MVALIIAAVLVGFGMKGMEVVGKDDVREPETAAPPPVPLLGLESMRALDEAKA